MEVYNRRQQEENEIGKEKTHIHGGKRSKLSMSAAVAAAAFRSYTNKQQAQPALLMRERIPICLGIIVQFVVHHEINIYIYIFLCVWMVG